MSFCGGTRRSLLECLAEQLPRGSFSNCLNTISSPLFATFWYSLLQSYSYGPTPPPSSTSKLSASIWPFFDLLFNSIPMQLLLIRKKKFLMWLFLMYRSPPRIPEVHIPEDPVLPVVNALRIEINRGLTVLREIASGRDLKKFLIVCICVSSIYLLGFNICAILLNSVDEFNTLRNCSRWYSSIHILKCCGTTLVFKHVLVVHISVLKLGLCQSS